MYDPQTGMNFNSDAEKAQDRSIVEFFMEAVQNNFLSEKEGRPVFDEVEKIRILIPGDNRTEVVERVKDEHRTRWAVAYAAFKAGSEQATDGIPVEEWPPLNKAQVATLKALNIRTVEALANLTDQGLASLGMGARDLRDKAQKYLQSANDAKPLAEALAAINTLRDEMEVLRQQNASLAALATTQKEQVRG